jgi:hypothetical protein
LARSRVSATMREWQDDGARPPGSPETIAPLVVALLIGLEMQHRVDPDAVDDDVAVTGLAALFGLDGADRELNAGGRPRSSQRSTARSG